MITLLQKLLQDNSYNTIDPDYQSNMYLIESAMRLLGKTDIPDFKPSPYDDALMELIDAVPRE